MERQLRERDQRHREREQRRAGSNSDAYRSPVEQYSRNDLKQAGSQATLGTHGPAGKKEPRNPFSHKMSSNNQQGYSSGGGGRSEGHRQPRQNYQQRPARSIKKKKKKGMKLFACFRGSDSDE
jgi:hypothetical protein